MYTFTKTTNKIKNQVNYKQFSLFYVDVGPLKLVDVL